MSFILNSLLKFLVCLLVSVITLFAIPFISFCHPFRIFHFTLYTFFSMKKIFVIIFGQPFILFHICNHSVLSTLAKYVVCMDLYFFSIRIVSAWQWIKISMKKHKQKKNRRLNVNAHNKKGTKRKCFEFPYFYTLNLNGREERKASSIWRWNGILDFPWYCWFDTIYSYTQRFTFIFVLEIW